MTEKQDRLLKYIMAIIAISCFFIFTPLTLLKAWILPLPDTLQEQVDEAIEHGFDGMIVYVDEAGKEPAFYSAGWKDRVNKIPADPKSLFKIASISKLYVAVSIAKLVKADGLSLDQKLADYFPELIGRIENAKKITIRMMLQHRSGIPNYTDNPDFWDDSAPKKNDVLDYAIDLPANFSPDEDYGYSNTNYLLLRRIIEKIVGYSSDHYIKEKILIPLGLKNTFASLSEVNLDDVMSGYYVGLDDDFKSVNQGMLATAEDVGIFLRALNNGSVFQAGEQEIYSSIYVYEHTGLVPGYQSIARYHKDIDAVVIQFVNTANFDGHIWEISMIVYSRIVKILRRDKALQIEKPKAKKDTIAVREVLISTATKIDTVLISKSKNSAKTVRPNISIREKKKRFADILVPPINKVFMELEKRYQEISVALKNGSEKERIEKLKNEFRAKTDKELLAALKPHPRSIVLAQAALESAWGTSRFFVQANNAFGVWSYSKNEARIAAARKRGDKTIWLKKYKSIYASVKDHYRILARGNTYKEFRALRVSSDNPYELVKKLNRYSENGDEYAKKLTSMIRFNKFTKYDSLFLEQK